MTTTNLPFPKRNFSLMDRETALSIGEGIVYGFEEVSTDELKELICFLDESYKHNVENADEQELLWILAGICGVDELDLDMDYYLGEDE